MDFDESFDQTFFHATFEIDLNDFDENQENLETPVFDSDTDDLLLSLDEQIMKGENVDLPQIDIADQLSENHEFPPLQNISKDNLLKYIDNGLNENIRKKTERDVRRFRDFLKMKGETREIARIPPYDLDCHLGLFFMDLKKSNGDPYEPSSITSIHRYFFKCLS